MVWNVGMYCLVQHRMSGGFVVNRCEKADSETEQYNTSVDVRVN